MKSSKEKALELLKIFKTKKLCIAHCNIIISEIKNYDVFIHASVKNTQKMNVKLETNFKEKLDYYLKIISEIKYL